MGFPLTKAISNVEFLYISGLVKSCVLSKMTVCTYETLFVDYTKIGYKYTEHVFTRDALGCICYLFNDTKVNFFRLNTSEKVRGCANK